MKKLFNNSRVKLAAALTVTILAGSVSMQADAEEVSGESWELLYEQAVKDAMTIEPEEILPVLAINEDEDQIRWNDEGKVLMVTLHRYPDSYPAGNEITMAYGDTWVTSLAEMEDWFTENYSEGQDEEDWTARFEMLLGMPADKAHTHFTAMWVDPADMIRPAYNPDVTDDEVLSSFEDPQNTDKEYKEWFDGNIIWSYFDSQYPWTRLGYTYDYADNGTEYGLSEFIVNQGASVDVEFTYTVDEMVEYLEEAN